MKKLFVVTSTMKSILLSAILACGVATNCSHAAPRSANTSSRHPQMLHFARGADKLSVRETISGSQHRFYTLKVNAGQHLKISAESDSQLVPIIFVTSPCGKFNGDKTATYSEDSSRNGIYRIEVATNLMASNANHGAFVLRVEAD